MSRHRSSFLLIASLSFALGSACLPAAPAGPDPPPVERLTQLGDGTYSDALYQLYCASGSYSLDGGATCERGCGPLDAVDRYCGPAGEVFHDAAGGATSRLALRFASVDAGACARIIKMLPQAPDMGLPVWDCSDQAQNSIPDFYAQGGRFYLAADATDYDLP